MPREINIAFIYTQLQRDIILSLNIEDIIIVAPKHREHLFHKNIKPILIETSDQNLTLKRSRALIRETNSKINSLTKNKQFTIWLASCDNPIGQIILNNKNCSKKILIEDGIGSYVKHAPLDANKGIRAFARKVKYLLFLFPHYRSIYGIGSLKADHYFAINPHAFPRSKNSNKTEVSKKYVDFLKKSLHNTKRPEIQQSQALYLDQPILRQGLSKHSLTNTLKSFLYEIEKNPNIKEYIIKPHPTSTQGEINETLRIFQTLTDKKVGILNEDCSIEEIAISDHFNPQIVFSFLSSGLYTIKTINPEINIKSLMHSEILKERPYITKYCDALKKIGVEVITFREKD
ncbi:hypothetical protein [Ectopseudomonas oleovorans]|uniref:hypothetical protein n=1 Tax=Ectopseudomonas oleovorans TaxID=301 RepID=UPI0035B2BF82